ncbi:iron complex transport system ATP-binding protein [Quadrisphaera granulorum]|uniref:Iron complex transport system ATP-binding protein n=1 Tax=Quadrisphaera granulorum TaxID=317664 RepID=A0A316A9N5_9ACTN|nr:ABC transporter ATP-binding protein [Quadrisphaera granulorum]PWJ54353.1 iron complex transport system ATP-binding protein [Quadrisphaera granulorum]SZE96125.1 iron complex transport system ATP-binding protein [Quadrisphaera granulorum]
MTTQTPASAHAPATDESTAGSRVRIEGVTLAYDTAVVVDDVTTAIPDGGFTAIIGPNGCGKSTLLRSVARVMTPRSGAVLLDGRDVTRYKPKELARQVGLLPQSSVAPDSISVAELVARGRFPHQTPFAQWSQSDERAVQRALRSTGVEELSTRPVEALSGGQRQRVWVAMALAQETGVLLLDEPTTYLDVAHQIELLDLFADLHEEGRTVVAVLHDLNHAARYATHLVVMRDGRVVAEGEPPQVLTRELVADVFGLAAVIIDDPETGTPLVVPRARSHRART